MLNKVRRGRDYESQAAKFLARSGLIVLERNWFYQHHGELDIIAFEPGVESLIFVEVRSQNTFWLDSSQIISIRKLLRLKRLVHYWLRAHRLARFDLQTRLDLVVINVQGISWYKAIG